MQRYVSFYVLLMSLVSATMLAAQANIDNSLHFTRQGKFTAYSAENGGMETITGIAMDTLACIKCHAPTYADGSPVDPATYVPSCNDCHDFTQGTSVAENTCLGCHSRQKLERQMMGTDTLDVHLKRGMVCMDCHTKEEIHGDDGVRYSSLLEPGAIKVKCTDCHTPLVSNTYHDIHQEKVDCDACHTESMIACASCHFESLLASGKNRPNAKINGFELLVKSGGKVTSATFMSHTYNGKTNFIIAKNHAHFILKNAKTCTDCHANMGGAVPAIQEYNSTGKITLTTWDEAIKKIKGPQGVVPIPADWKRALQLDYAGYNGDPAVFPSDDNAWYYVKSETDNSHLFFCEPLDTTTMKKLGFTAVPTSVAEQTRLTPTGFVLEQNYPNPFNPSTTIVYRLGRASDVTITVLDLLGRKLRTLARKQQPAGKYSVHWDGKDDRGRAVASGVYFCRMKAGRVTQTKKMILIR